MQKFIALCGKDCIPQICYTYPKIEKKDIVIMSVDELIKDLFSNEYCEYYEEMTLKVRNYITKKSVELINAGCAVLLDFGLCSIKCREELKEFYQEQDIHCQWYYMEFEDTEWHMYVDERGWKILNRDRGFHKKGFTDLDSVFFKRALEGLDIPSEFGVELSLKIERK